MDIVYKKNVAVKFYVHIEASSFWFFAMYKNWTEKEANV